MYYVTAKAAFAARRVTYNLKVLYIVKIIYFCLQVINVLLGINNRQLGGAIPLLNDFNITRRIYYQTVLKMPNCVREMIKIFVSHCHILYNLNGFEVDLYNMKHSTI